MGPSMSRIGTVVCRIARTQRLRCVYRSSRNRPTLCITRLPSLYSRIWWNCLHHLARRLGVRAEHSLRVGSSSRRDSGLPCSGLMMSPNGVRDISFCMAAACTPR